ncbi:MAG: FISUMP domain-containing protein [Mariniphaga sp.]
MKYLIIPLLIFCLSFSITKSQSITNVSATQKGNSVEITYNLQCNESAEISLYVSENNDGKFSGPLKSVSGDVGANITSGSKTIIWNTLQETDVLAGDNIIFRVKGLPKFGIMTDSRDNKSYKTVKIGNQIMMAENLAYKPSSGSYWAFKDNMDNVTKCGYLYDWETAMNVCPTGWHLPNKAEFDELIHDVVGYESLISGGKSGFNVQFAGNRDPDGDFRNMNDFAFFWSSTCDAFWNKKDKNACSFWMCTTKDINWNCNFYQSLGLSVRCFRDK